MQPILAGPRPLDFGEKLNAAFTVTGRTFADLARIVVVFTTPVAVLAAGLRSYLTTVQDDWYPVEETARRSADVEPGEVAIVVGLTFLTFVLGWIAQQLATAGSIRVLSSTIQGQPASWQESLAFAWERKGTVLWLSVVSALGTMLFTFLCVLPGIIAYVGWSVAMPVLLLEGARSTDALGRSWDLVKPRWWSVFGMLLVVGIGTAIASSCLGSSFGMAAGASDVAAVDFIGSLISAMVTNLITLPITAAVVLILYVDLRWRNEGVWLGPSGPAPYPYSPAGYDPRYPQPPSPYPHSPYPPTGYDPRYAPSAYPPAGYDPRYPPPPGFDPGGPVTPSHVVPDRGNPPPDHEVVVDLPDDGEPPPPDGSPRPPGAISPG